MYESKFDVRNIVDECVDYIRKTTNAPLADCHVSLLGIMGILEPHLSSSTSTSEIFNAINKQSIDYTVNIESCYDRRCVNDVCERLYDQFMEKQELSCMNQNDEEFIENLTRFGDIAKKTDPRIPFLVISSDDFYWMKQLLIVLEMDQSVEVQKSLIDVLQILISRCDETMKNFLIEMQLTKILVSFTSQSGSEELKKRALHVLSLMFDVAISPPLDQLDYLNADYFRCLYQSISKIDGSDVFNLCVNFFYHVRKHGVSSDAVFEPIISDPFQCSQFGIVCIEELNDVCSVRRLEFFQEILKLGPEILQSVFYANDLKVLARVLTREMTDHQDVEVRNLCRRCNYILQDTGGEE